MAILILLIMTIEIVAGMITRKGDDVTVSGLSSGGFMSGQIHFAHSATIRGASIFGGGPHHCIQKSIKDMMVNS